MSKMDEIYSASQKMRPSQRREQDKPVLRSEWPRCEAHGCNMMSSVSKDRKLCGFHAKAEFIKWQATNQAIDSMKAYIVKYVEMQKWGPIEWKQKFPLIMNWDFCPMYPDDLERPSLYMGRLWSKIHEEIESRTDEIFLRQ